MTGMTHHEDGVYLNLREDSYLADPALGYTSTRLLKNPPDWWFGSPYNTVMPRPPRDQKTFERGTAAHVKFLEPKGTYEKVYGVVPTKATHPDHLDTIPELVEACRKHKLAPTYTVKSDLVDRLVRGVPGIKILEVARQQFFASGKKPISAEDHARIMLSYQMAMRTPQELGVSEDDLTLADAFDGGLSEVSIFWTDDAGIRQRARIDKLKPHITLDLKTITEWKPSDFKKSLLREIVIKGYLLQVVHYNDARRRLQQFVANGKVFGGTKAQRTLLKRIAKQTTWSWGFVFAKMSGFPAVRAIIFSPEQMGMVEGSGDVMGQFAKAADERRDALTMFQFYRDTYGLEPGVIWHDTEVIWQPSHTDWDVNSVWAGEN